MPCPCLASGSTHLLLFITLPDALLALLSADVYRAIEAIYAADVPVWSLDLMSGLPELTEEMWGYSLAQALDAAPHHISVYDLQACRASMASTLGNGNTWDGRECMASHEEAFPPFGRRHGAMLTWEAPTGVQVEDHTPFSRLYIPGEAPLPTEDAAAGMYCAASTSLRCGASSRLSCTLVPALAQVCAYPLTLGFADQQGMNIMKSATMPSRATGEAARRVWNRCSHRMRCGSPRRLTRQMSV